jgi:hypothetical protein
VEERENDVECWELKKLALSVETIVDGLSMYSICAKLSFFVLLSI